MIRTPVARPGGRTVLVGLFALNGSFESPSAGHASQVAAHPEQAVIEGLVLASRMLAHPELDILDAFGHVSVRSPSDPNHYPIPRYV